jgi:hypothetical protein
MVGGLGSHKLEVPHIKFGGFSKNMQNAQGLVPYSIYMFLLVVFLCQ